MLDKFARSEGVGMVNLDEILSSTTVEAVTTLIEKISASKPIRWIPVGGRSNNLATINIGSDPAAGLTERITNAFDAVLEREWLEQGKPGHIQSPRQAVEAWFGIPDGHLDGVDARDPKMASLSARVRVALRDSGSGDNPTIDIRDFGVGLLAHEFGNSILGLNESLKLNKFFLAGAYGQGGSTALSFSIYALILSRRIALPGGRPNPVAFSIVRFNDGDPTTDKHGLYEYLVDRGTGHPLLLDVPEDVFGAGTLVRHVRMNIGKYHSVMTAPTGSLWYLAQHYLFDPVLPFRIVEERPNPSNGTSRFIGGNFRRLTRRDTDDDTGGVEYQRSATVGFRNGQISIHWWVLAAIGDLQKARNRISNYVLPSKPIVITFNGQKQGDLPNTVIKNDLRLPYLERYLIVQVNCDGLDANSRRQLFSTTRESLRDSGLLDDLRAEIVDKLRADDELKRLDAQRKQRYMRQSSSESTEHLRRRLASRLRTFLRAGEAGPGPTTTPPPNSPGPFLDERPAIPVSEPPTFLLVTTSSPHSVFAGKSFRVHFKTDADPKYFVDPDAFMAVVTPPSFGRYTGSATVYNGYGIAYFHTNQEVNVGDSATIALEVRPPRQRTLGDTLTVQVEALPETSGPRGNRTNAPNLQIVPVDQEHAYYIDNNWTELSVASAEESSEETTVYVSVANARLGALIQKAQRHGQEAVDSIKGFYIEHIAFHAVLVQLGLAAAVKSTADEEAADASEEWSDTTIGTFRDQELRRACETICGVIDATFDFILQAGPGHTDAP